MPFSVENFLSLADLGEVFKNLRKSELVQIAEYFGLNTNLTMKKAEIKNIVATELIEKEFLDSGNIVRDDQSSLHLKLEMKKLELEKERIELEKEKIELEKLKIRENRNQNSDNFSLKTFDIGRYIKLVPTFFEKTVEKYFPHFEKIAVNLGWPYEIWATLLQTVLVGRAADIYSALSIEDASDYEKIKNAILNAYELVPEAYRQKFRKYKKFERQTYVEFAREKEDLFDRWVRAKKIDDYEKLRQLILIEEFKQCVPNETRMYLEDKNINTINEAAVMADTHRLTHRSFEKINITENQSGFTQQTLSESHPNVYHRKYTQKKIRDTQKSFVPTESKIFCAYCKKDNHIISDCRILKRKREENNSFQPHAFTQQIKNDSSPQLFSKVGDDENTENACIKNYRPFLSQGFVYSSNPDEAKPVQILRDTGASQTLLLERALKLSESTFTGDFVLLQGVELGVIKVPLHKIYIKSELVNGPVIVGVRPTLPVKGVSLLLGNDLAGDRVIAEPIVCDKIEKSKESLVEEDRDLYPDCAITRARAKKQISESDDLATDGLLQLNKTFISHNNNPPQKENNTRKKKRICHINMLKSYIDRNDLSNIKPISTLTNINITNQSENDIDKEEDVVFREKDMGQDSHLKNSEILSNLNVKFEHLSNEKRQEIHDLVSDFKNLFPDVPEKTTVAVHDVLVGEEKPIKQHFYRVNPIKLQQLRAEVKYMLDNDIIEPSQSQWSSPCILVPKPDGTYRFVTDFRKVNAVTKSDSFPIPRIDDCIDNLGKAKYVSKFDLMKGYWQVPLTDNAKEISAFVTPDGLYQYKVMAFGMKNAPATFQRMMHSLLHNIQGCEVYIDDVIVYSMTWDEHLHIIRKFFQKLEEANLCVNLSKSEFCCAKVNYLGHTVGQGQVKPITAKVDAILKYPIPTNKKQLMRFLGMAGFYRKFCKNFSSIASPLTDLLKKNVKYKWSEACDGAFNKIKSTLIGGPALATPVFSKQFKLQIDASDVGMGGVLIQEDDEGIDRAIGYFSKKLNTCQKNYSTIEKECLAVLSTLQHFDFYLNVTVSPVLVYTDHNPLTFLQKMANKNQRLTRWSLLLQEYDIIVVHIKGKNNVIADALSRI